MPDWSSEIRERLAGLDGRSGPRGLDRRGDRPASRRPLRRAARAGRRARGGAPVRARRARRPRARRRRWPTRFRARRRLALPPAEDGGRLALRPRPGLPLRRAAPAPRAALRARRDPLARARHRRQHGDLPAPRRRPPAHACRSSGPTSSTTSASRREVSRTGNFSGHWPQLTSALWERHPNRAEGVLEARRLELRPRQPRLRAARLASPNASGSAARSSTPSASRPLRGPGPRAGRRRARLPLARRRPQRALLAARARRPGDRSRPDPRGRGPSIRDRRSHAGAFLRRGSRPGLRRRHSRPAPRTSSRTRRARRGARDWWLAAVGRLAPGLDAREGERAPRRDFQAGSSSRRCPKTTTPTRREELPRLSSSSGPSRLDGLLGSPRGLLRPALAPARHLGARAPHRLRQHRQPHGRPGERPAARDRRAPGARRVAAAA